MSRKQEIQNEIRELSKELNDINQAQSKEENKKLIGKCFKSKNSNTQYGSWWVYKRVVDLNEEFEPILATFQKCSNGRIVITEDYLSMLFESDIKIEEEEYNEAWQSLLNELIERS